MNAPTRKQLADHLKTVNVTHFALRHGIPRRTLMRVKLLRRSEAAPSERTLTKIADGIERDVEAGVFE